ncbi:MULTISPECIES: hypothetical protein [unclassified Streptomyces]|uniref:hypothetical protein n=1 Tax=unclassified Streptomyces TaxID=2593676 RepID=UPI00386DDFF3|nr:hypothetical protein OG569_17625 [Streptomyces sp. NBC_00827]
MALFVWCVRAVPVTGLPPTDLLLAWPAESRDRRIAEVLDLARTVTSSVSRPAAVRAAITPAAG